MATPTIDRTPERLTPRHGRLGLLGLGLLTGMFTLFMVVVLVQIPEELGFIGLPFAVVAATTVLVWRVEAIWSRVIGAVVSLAAGVLFFFFAFGLTHLTSVVEFVAAWMFVPGVVLGVVGNVMAIVQRRRGRFEATATGAERRIATGMAAVLAVALVASSIAMVTARESVDAVAAAEATVVDMKNFEFEPTIIEVGSGDQLLVANRDAFLHDFTVPDLDIEVDVVPWSETLIDLEDAAGSYIVYCTLHSDTTDPSPDPDDDMMVATLVVR